MFQVNMVAHLWDLVDEGLDGVLDLLQGRIGITGLCTPVTYGPARHLRYGPDVSPRIFQTRGGVFFQPDKTCYANTRCKPLVSEWLKTRNPLQKLAERCRERGLRLRAVIECTNIGRIAAHDPYFARKNVFGDISTSQVCLVQADVAELFRALAGDVCRNYAIDTVELTGLDALAASPDDPLDSLGRGGRQLLALCFCESCKQAAGAAGVDVESAARSTVVRLEGVFRTGQPIEPPLAALAADDPPLSAFMAWYRARLTELLGGMSKACSAELLPHIRPLHGEMETACDIGHAAGADGVICDYAGWETSPLERLIERIRGTLTAEQRLEVQLPVHPPAPADDQALFRNLTRVMELGLASANLDHYGCLPRARIEAVKQAVRFPRRASG
jgi:hypothetical protein